MKCFYLPDDGTRCEHCGASYVCPHQHRYYLSATLGTEKVEREVTLEEFCRAERAAGFRPKLPSTDRHYMTTPATGGFSSGGISGRSVYVGVPSGISASPDGGEGKTNG